MNFSIIDKQVLSRLYTATARQSIYQVLCAVRKIGNHDMENKENVINEAMNTIGLTGQDRIASRKLSLQQMTLILQQMDEGKKLYLAKFISNVALVGGTTNNETKFVYQLFNMFQIPQI